MYECGPLKANRKWATQSCAVGLCLVEVVTALKTLSWGCLGDFSLDTRLSL